MNNHLDRIQEEIRILELQQDLDLAFIKEQVQLKLESITPLNIIKNSISDLGSSPYLTENLMNHTLGIAAGLMAKKLIKCSSQNTTTHTLGILIEFSIANYVAKNGEIIIAFGGILIGKFFNRFVNIKDDFGKLRKQELSKV